MRVMHVHDGPSNFCWSVYQVVVLAVNFDRERIFVCAFHSDTSFTFHVFLFLPHHTVHDHGLQ
jgi:hypothetical protein